jgi:hypothetical protein
MQIWQHFKKSRFNKSLNKGLAARTGLTVPKPLSFHSAKSVAFLFDAENPKVNEEILKYAGQCQKKGKSIFLLGLHANAKELLELPFPCLKKNDIDWAGRPFGKLFDEWLLRPVDIVIHVSSECNEPLAFITALTPAGLRIGPVTNQTSCYDLMLDVPPDTSPQSFFKQLEYLLGKIEVRNEPIRL